VPHIAGRAGQGKNPPYDCCDSEHTQQEHSCPHRALKSRRLNLSVVHGRRHSLCDDLRFRSLQDSNSRICPSRSVNAFSSISRCAALVALVRRAATFFRESKRPSRLRRPSSCSAVSCDCGLNSRLASSCCCSTDLLSKPLAMLLAYLICSVSTCAPETT